MNTLMINVARDRQTNGAHFDNIFKDKKRSYTKEDTRNPGGNDEELAPENRAVLVYNDFNISQLLAHAAMGTAGGDELPGAVAL